MKTCSQIALISLQPMHHQKSNAIFITRNTNAEKKRRISKEKKLTSGQVMNNIGNLWLRQHRNILI